MTIVTKTTDFGDRIIYCYTEGSSMKPNEHPHYDRALARAAERAHDNKGDCFTVWWDGENIYVRASEAAGPANGKVVCIAQYWANDTVQLRFAGAHSEWRTL